MQGAYRKSVQVKSIDTVKVSEGCLFDYGSVLKK